MLQFPTEIKAIKKHLGTIDPKRYAKTRNYGNGAVTKLSPYISRGVISTRQVYNHIAALNKPWHETEKLIQELAWRDYWQQVWLAKKDAIHNDLKNPQTPVINHQIPRAIVRACTGINVVDAAIETLYQSGYMHNHMRMYVASICCNIAHSHWLMPARWMYAHLLDGDIASNQLSWQWVAGAFANKKYYANQTNINKYFNSAQKNTFLDIPYERFASLEAPPELQETVPLSIDLQLPEGNSGFKLTNRPSLIYNYYNLDPEWYADDNMQRILLLEPSVFNRYRVTPKAIDFALALADNIPGIMVYKGEFADLLKYISAANIRYKEHPLNTHYQGREEPRQWLSSVNGYYPGFFAFWKKCQKELRY
jgi:deoxyribodipyrimidine photo-lyase